MIDQLRKKGYNYGSGILSPDKEKFIVNIPKNASSYILDWTRRHGWSTTEIESGVRQQNVKEVIVILRDPVQRWISGMGQYITGYVLNVTGAYSLATGPGPHDQQISGEQFVNDYNQVVERLLFDNLDRHDDHVWPQCEFFEKLLPAVPRKYFYLDNNFDTQFSQYMKFESIGQLDRNSGESNPHTAKVQQFIKQRLSIRPELKQRVIDAYARDYQLIKEVFND